MTLMKPVGFWEVVGHKPRKFKGMKARTTSTFATKPIAEKFAVKHGGTVRHRPADGIMVDGKII